MREEMLRQIQLTNNLLSLPKLPVVIRSTSNSYGLYIYSTGALINTFKYYAAAEKYALRKGYTVFKRRRNGEKNGE